MPKKLQFTLVGLGFSLALIYLLVTGIQATGVEYVEFTELDKITQKNEPTSIKITGKVKKESLNYDPHKPLINFQLSGPEKQDSVRVRYEGMKPDAMREEGHVIIEGKYRPGKNYVQAHTLLAKCPSRYKSEYKEYSANNPS